MSEMRERYPGYASHEEAWAAYLDAKSRLTEEQKKRIMLKCRWEQASWFAVFLDWPSVFGKPRCETCDGDGYVDVMDDWGGVVGPAPCPECSDLDPFNAPAFRELGYEVDDEAAADARDGAAT